MSLAVKKIKVASVYMGGGTPSLLNGGQIKQLFHKVKEYFNFTKDTRIVVESSPFTLDSQKIKALKKSNVYEINLGIQSFDQDVLNKNIRPMKAEQSIEIIKAIKNEGLPSVAIDLMVGLPYQSKESALKSAEIATSLEIDGIHVFAFQPSNTRFYREGNKYSKEDISRRQGSFTAVKLFLENKGYKYTSGGHRKHWTKKDEELTYEIEGANSLMGIGYGAISHAYGSLKYESHYSLIDFAQYFQCRVHNLAEDENRFENDREYPDKREIPFIYKGVRVDLSKEMNMYAYTFLDSKNFSEFKKIFKKDFTSVFKTQLQILSYLNLIKIQNNSFQLLSNSSFTKNIVRSFFLNKEYIHRAIDFYGEEYNPKTDYAKLLTAFCR